MTAMAVLIGLLLGAVGMTKGYAYNVTIGSTSNGTVVASTTTANEGETVTLTATPQSQYGFALENWTVTDENNEPITITQNGDNPNIGTFTMPASNVTVTDSFFRSFLFFAIFEDYMASEERVPKERIIMDIQRKYTV